MCKFYLSALLGMILAGAGVAVGQEAEPKNAVEDAFKRTEFICRDVERLRGLKFKSKVTSEVQSMDNFRKFVAKSILEQYGKEESVWFVRALVRMGALDREMDLASTLTRLLESQAAAHYDPETKKCYLLMTDMDSRMTDVILAHELCHALDDQYFNLFDFAMKDVKGMRDNGDSAAGKECLLEGEATLVMMSWLLNREGGMENSAVGDAALSMAINAQGALDYDALLSMADGKADVGIGGFSAAMKEMKDLPRYFMESIYSTYIQGSMMVNAVKTRGGWAAVNDLYKNPPQSTEQVLHPEKLIGQRDVPLDVRLPGLASTLPGTWELKEEDVMGELGIKVLLELWCTAEARDPAAIATAAAGWGGDRYYFLVNKASGKDVLVWKTVWDSSQDAGEFTTAYRLLLATRFPKMKKAGHSGPADSVSYQVWEVEPGRFLKLVTQDTMVGVMDTADKACLDAIWH